MDASSVGRKRTAEEAELGEGLTVGDRGYQITATQGPAEAADGGGSTSGDAPEATQVRHVADDSSRRVDGRSHQLELQEALKALEREKLSVEDGSHCDLVQRCAVFESVRLQAVADATNQREDALKSVENIYQFMLHSAERICEKSKQDLRASLSKDVSERISDLNARLTGHPEPRQDSRAQPKRQLRSKTKGDTEPTGAAQPGAELAQLTPSSSLRVDLPAVDIMTDMKAIYRDWKATASRWRAAVAVALLPARVERGRLYYANETFAKGEPVVVFSELTKQEFVGEVYNLSAGEAIVKLDGGTKCRIPLQHLRHGRVSMYRYVPPMGVAGVATLAGEGNMGVGPQSADSGAAVGSGGGYNAPTGHTAGGGRTGRGGRRERTVDFEGVGSRGDEEAGGGAPPLPRVDGRTLRGRGGGHAGPHSRSGPAGHAAAVVHHGQAHARGPLSGDENVGNVLLGPGPTGDEVMDGHLSHGLVGMGMGGAFSASLLGGMSMPSVPTGLSTLPPLPGGLSMLPLPPGMGMSLGQPIGGLGGLPPMPGMMHGMSGMMLTAPQMAQLQLLGTSPLGGLGQGGLQVGGSPPSLTHLLTTGPTPLAPALGHSAGLTPSGAGHAQNNGRGSPQAAGGPGSPTAAPPHPAPVQMGSPSLASATQTAVTAPMPAQALEDDDEEEEEEGEKEDEAQLDNDADRDTGAADEGQQQDLDGPFALRPHAETRGDDDDDNEGSEAGEVEERGGEGNGGQVWEQRPDEAMDQS